MASIPALAQTIISGKIQNVGKKVIISYYQDYKYHNDTLELDENDNFRQNYAFSSLTYFRLETIQPESFSSFLFVMPNEHIHIIKTSSGIKISGNLASFNNFVQLLNNEMSAKFRGVKVDDHQRIQYKLDKLNEYFSASADQNDDMLKSLSTLDAIADLKLYPVLVKWNADGEKMQALAQMFKTGKSPQQYSELFGYLDRIDFDGKFLSEASVPSLSVINNFIRILRMHEVNRDTLLKDQDEYIIERQIIRKLFKETAFRAKLMGFNLSSRIASYTKYPMGLSGVDEYLADYRKDKFTTAVADAIEKQFSNEKSKLGSLSKGAKAPAFKLPDNTGKEVSLSNFSGKVVYLDLWASWCGPCLAEMPYLQKLRKKYANKDVAIVAISIDTDSAKWQKKIKELKLDGVQLIDKIGSQNSKIAKDYKVNGVPHYVLIDKSGRIASAYAPIPSSVEAIEQAIDLLLK